VINVVLTLCQNALYPSRLSAKRYDEEMRCKAAEALVKLDRVIEKEKAA
jgi:Tfp pilus assembly protein PilX